MKPIPTLLLLGLLLTCAAALSKQSEPQDAPPPPEAAPPRRTAAAAPVGGGKADITLSALPASPRGTILQHALEDGDVCSVNALLDDMPTSEIFGAFLRAVDASSELLETYGSHGPMLTPLPSKLHFHSLAARAAAALELAGFDISPVNTPGSNPRAALALMEKLEQENPGNAFYPLVRLVLEYRLGFSLDRLKATAETAAGATVLESPFRGLAAEVDEASWRNPALRFLVTQVFVPPSGPFEASARVLNVLTRESGFRGSERIASLLAASSSAPGSIEDLSDTAAYAAAHLLKPTRYPAVRASERTPAWKALTLPSLERSERGVPVCDAADYENAFFEARGTGN